MKNRKAFTILEILIAFFILATSLHVLLKIQMRSLLRVADHQQTFLYTLLAREKLNQVLYQDAALLKKTKESDDDLVTVTDYEELENNQSLGSLKNFVQKASVQVSWQTGPDKQQVSMACLARK